MTFDGTFSQISGHHIFSTTNIFAKGLKRPKDAGFDRLKDGIVNLTTIGITDI